MLRTLTTWLGLKRLYRLFETGEQGEQGEQMSVRPVMKPPNILFSYKLVVCTYRFAGPSNLVCSIGKVYERFPTSCWKTLCAPTSRRKTRLWSAPPTPGENYDSGNIRAASKGTYHGKHKYKDYVFYKVGG